MTAVLWWLRNDLRLTDNPALQQALALKPNKLNLVYFISPQLGSASRWWLHHSLQALEKQLQERGQALHVSVEDPVQILPELVESLHISHVVVNTSYEPLHIQRDKLLQNTLKKQGCAWIETPSYLLHEPEEIKTGQGHFFQKYTPFWRACSSQLIKSPPQKILGPAPKSMPPYQKPKNLAFYGINHLDRLDLCPKSPNWAKGFELVFEPGELAAKRKWMTFLRHHLLDYKEKRDYPGVSGTSQLSPHLHFGEIAPYRLYHMAEAEAVEETYLKELVWREFSYHLLYHFPALPEAPLNAQFAQFPWHEDAKSLARWQKGETGFPIVDAGMRELWATGWMHNRVRMIVASFLVKDLFIHWRQGADWFWDTLVDADLANNSASWQWVAGSGADAAPYFRIFNPTLQSQKFDPEGHYIKKWLPELKDLSSKEIHAPHEALSHVKLAYPKPMVNHAERRDMALAYYQKIKKSI